MIGTHRTSRPAPSEAATTAAFVNGPDQRIDVGHSRLAYWRFGCGPDVVLVHGWPLHAATFRRVIPLLADDFTLHAFDLPGAGKTDCDEGAPTDLVSHVTTVRRAIDALGLLRYAFVAHDSGATIARMIAAGDSRVSGIVMGNTEIPGHHSWLIRMLVSMGRTPGARGTLFGLMRWRAARRWFFGGCFTDPAYVEGEFCDLFIRPLFTSKRAAEGQLGLIRSLDFDVIDGLAEAHARIRVPVLCVWGPRDPFFPIADARAMLPQFSGGAELVEIPKASIFAHEDHAEEFAAAARPLLKRCLGVG